MKRINLNAKAALGIHANKVAIYERVLLRAHEYRQLFKLTMREYLAHHADRAIGPWKIHEVLKPVRERTKLTRYRKPHQGKQECERRRNAA